MNLNFEKIMPYVHLFGSGILVTLEVAALAAIGGSILGLAFSLLGRKGSPVRYLVKGIVEFFRGTPLLIQLTFFHLGLPQVTGWIPDVMTSALIVFSINSGAYLSEILRAGIESIDKGQIEAAHALGVKNFDITFSIIIPQALRNVLPAIMNEFITLVKETSVVSVIGLTDIMRREQMIASVTYRYFEPSLIAMMIYLVLNIILSFVGKKLERALKYD
ncbi:MAG: amino acid ABC transporter permease [Erysipelotrichaceae bacterium]|nr:amino acid ABC transporter permease [Erysipelotrichaceae bacterium]